MKKPMVVDGETYMLVESSPTPDTLYKIGAHLLIRTVTMYSLGVVVYVSDTEVVLDSAAWIPDTGRLSAALKTGQLKEVEMYGSRMSVSRGAIVDAIVWKHSLPTESKP